MRGGVSFPLYAATWLFTLLIVHCHAKVVPYLQPGFSFGYDGPQQAVALPVTAQCELVRLKWSRGKATGVFIVRAPTAQISKFPLMPLARSSASPYIIAAGPGPSFEWQVPFAPQTQYQICMYDNFGVSGGCQAMRTMVASPTNVTSCQNVTSLPSLPVSTSLDDPSKPVTQLPVISQCEQFSVSATTGQAPYTLTIAPSRHPPVNISSSSAQIDWTVALPEGFPFFASVTSADGLFWSRGPLYVDGTGSTDCLAPGSM
ncbi:hypothetical protein EST38_g159 [Candolleomyces aberdarensis]|uniref:Uncharacterized protein n=1 Tax=Candolleomyces aberdarensis TaxID=2316362 RepID=A0A4Q2E2Q2_9AGAR|nr:hypothetical protein EST38_g159 [Candolleomyces aberdarensis]